MRVIVYPEPRLSAPRYYRDGLNERHQEPTSLSWAPKPLRQFVLPTFCHSYWQPPPTTESAPAPADDPGIPIAWRRPITYQPYALPIWFNGNIGEDVPPADVQLDTKEHVLRPLRQPPPPKTLYLFSPAISGTSIPEPHTHQQWSKPPLQRPYQPGPMLRQILTNLANPEPGPQSEAQSLWIVSRMQPPTRPILRYLFNPAQDVQEEPSSQFTVFWSYQTRYEDKVRQAFLRSLQSGSKDGVQIPESPSFPGFTNRPIRVNQVPAIAKLLYQNNPAQDFNSTPEGPTFEGFVNRRMWPFMAPKGAYMYYRSGFSKDEPDPLPTPSGGGRLPVIYMRRLELLGVRWGISAG